jgi:hypothetical protein
VRAEPIEHGAEVALVRAREGVEDPLSFDDVVKKFRANCLYGGLTDAQATDLLALLQSLLQSPKVDLRPLRCA